VNYTPYAYFLAAAAFVRAQLHAVLSSFETGTTCAVACWSSLAMSRMIYRSLSQLWLSGADALSARAAEGVVARPAARALKQVRSMARSDTRERNIVLLSVMLLCGCLRPRLQDSNIKGRHCC
jgi:hypothetical protein